MEATLNRPTEIFYTSDYSIFKKMKENRDVDKKRVKKVIKSIKAHGLICDPIRVNSLMEVGEGQATLEAYKELGLEVPYFIDPNLTSEKARVLNSSRTSWKEYDYIKSFATSGKESYKFLYRMVCEYPSIPLSAIEGILKGRTSVSGGTTDCIRSGKLDIPNGLMIEVENKLRYINRFAGVLNTKKGRKSYWYHALSFCYDEPTISNERLLDKFQTYSADISPVADIIDAIEQLQAVYNKGSREGKRYIRHLYEVAKEKK